MQINKAVGVGQILIMDMTSTRHSQLIKAAWLIQKRMEYSPFAESLSAHTHNDSHNFWIVNVVSKQNC